MPGLNPRNSEPRFAALLAGFKPKVFAVVLAGGLAGVWAISRLTSPPKDESRIALAARPDGEIQGSMPQPGVDSALTLPPGEASADGAAGGAAGAGGSAAASPTGGYAGAGVPTSDGAPTPPGEAGGAALTAKALDGSSHFNGTPSGGGGGTSASAGVDTRDARASLASASRGAAAGSGAARGRMAMLGGRSVTAARGGSSRGQAFAGGGGSFGSRFAGSGQTGTEVSAARAGGALQGENAGAAVVPLTAAPNAGQTKDVKNMPTPEKPEDKSQDSQGDMGTADQPAEEPTTGDQCYKSGKTTRCGAYTCAAKETSDLAATLNGLQKAAVTDLDTLIFEKVTKELQTVQKDEKTLHDQITKGIPTLKCVGTAGDWHPFDRSTFGCESCLVKDAEAAAEKVQTNVLTPIEEELKALAEAHACLSSAGSDPVSREKCRELAHKAIDTEEKKVIPALEAHASWVKNYRYHCRNQMIPKQKYRWVTRNGRRVRDIEANNITPPHEANFQKLADADLKAQTAVLTALKDKSWCQRHGCKAVDLADIKKKTQDHSDNVSGWASDIPDGSIVPNAGKSAEQTAAASPLLAKPTADSAEAVDGTIDLNIASVATSEESLAWNKLRDDACKNGKR